MLKRTIAILTLSLLCAALTAQVNEKNLPSVKDPNVIANLFNNRAATTTGNITGGPTYNRIFTGSVDPNCNAASTLSGIGVGVPYASIEIRSTTGENLVAAVNPAGTDIADTVLSLYCDPFNPADAQANLVAYNDDANGLLSAFDGTEGAFMQANTSYFLVLSLFSPGAIGGGQYQIDLGGNILLGPPCNIISIDRIPQTNTLRITGFCPSGIDIYVGRRDGSTQLLATNIPVDGTITYDVPIFPDSFYFVTPTGDSTILATTKIEVPTLSQWGLIAFLALLGLAGLYFMRRRAAA